MTQAQSLSLRSDAVAALLQHEIKPVILLGAGASFKSGIPLAGHLVDSIARFAYCKVHNRNPDDPTLMRSDWIRWLERQTWFRADVAPANHYPLAVEHLLQPQSNRKEFFQRILKPDVPASEGYKRLANLLARRLVRTVLTTNFDDLIVRSARETPSVRHVDEIRTVGDHTLFKTNPSHPQVVYLHGSVNHYTDRNLVEETKNLDSTLVALLKPLLRDHPLIVIGYRGAEPSVMKHLLIDQTDACARFREGIYWCHLPDANPTADSPLVAELAASIGSNLQFVEIEGFDELMIALDRAVLEPNMDFWKPEGNASEANATHHANDLLPSTLLLSDLNEPLLRSKLLAYADAMRLPPPRLDTSTHLWNAMAAQSLAITINGEMRVTNGGQLLFAKTAAQQMEQARLQITVTGPEKWVNEVLEQAPSITTSSRLIEETIVISGDLWTQLDQVSALLSRVNRPFRLKGPVSQTAYPYPPLALKELVTNLLAHRKYADLGLAKLTITPEEIRFENPGGLVESLKCQLEDEPIQQAVGEGIRRLKGYRNPVIADFFFSAGAMDKEGSGLPDVLQEAANNLNTVDFGPTNNNESFVAIIRCRPEALLMDQETKTAKPQQGELRYSPNLLRIVEWPDLVTKLGTVATPQELGRVEKAQPAPFGSHRNWIWTFANVTAPSARPLVELGLNEECYQVKTTELLNDRDAGSVLPRILNIALGRYLVSRGLSVRFESASIRAYYPSAEGLPREITYRSTFRQSKRTVTKPVVSRSSGKVVYWEHKAVSLRFERFGTEWALSLLPGYIFTIDGDSRSIPSEKIGPLSTRRAARDYNPTVLHDLVFWARMLSGYSEDAYFNIPVADGESAPSIKLASMIPTFVFQEAIETGISDATESVMSESERDQLQEEIEQVISETIGKADDSDEAPDS